MELYRTAAQSKNPSAWSGGPSMMRLAKGLWRGGKATCARFCESASKVLQIGEQMAANRRAWCRKSTSFVGGVTLHSGSTSAALGDRIAAVPMDVLWTA